MKNKYLWYSDTHFNFTFPWTPYNFVSKIIEENPKGLILTGDIACGLTLKNTLTFLSKKLDPITIYFVMGNHDSYGISFEESEKIIYELTAKYSNLIWITQKDIFQLSDEVCLIGEEGWYDGRLGHSDYLVYNFDWIMIEEFRKLSSIQEKLALTRKLADASTVKIKEKLLQALDKYKTIYIMTHVPPWAEATRSIGTELENFWLPYNVNSGMGKMIESIMSDQKDKNVRILAGHTHSPTFVNVSHNIECLVQSGKYLGNPTEHNCLFI